MRNSITTPLIFLPLTIYSTSLGQHRIFLEQVGANPVDTPNEGSIVETAAGAIVNLEVFIEDVDFPLRLKGCQASIPCSVPCSGGGSASYLDQEPICCGWLPHHCFFGRFCSAGPNIGSPCTSSNHIEVCGAAGICPTNSCFCVMDNGSCDTFGGLPRFAAAQGTTEAAIVLEDDAPFPPGGTFNGGLCGFGTFRYQLSPDAKGDCVIELPNEPASASRDQNDMPIPFTTSPITLRVPVGACCSPANGCQANTTHAECQALAPTSCNTWLRDEDCTTSPCGCTSDECCADASVCSCDTCTKGSCGHTSRFYGDANCSGGDANMDDILCALDGFRNIANCSQADFAPTCNGNGLINLDDILQVIVGFSGGDPCACD